LKHALSNIALSPYDHLDQVAQLRGLGIQGLEVAPSRVWRDTWRGLTQAEVDAYRRDVEATGLQVVGLHSLLYDQPDLELFGGGDARARLLDFLEHLSRVCRDLGGKTLIWGGGRRRGDTAPDVAFGVAAEFMRDLCKRVEVHGTVFCFEPLGPADSDFINTSRDSLAIVEAVNHPALQVQLDAKALVENAEAAPETFQRVADRLVHFHANEPGLGVLGNTGAVDHGALGIMLQAAGYDGYVSAEQRMLNGDDPLADAAASITVLKECYP